MWLLIIVFCSTNHLPCDDLLHIYVFQVSRLLYTNSGVGILALGSNGVQKLWKWFRNDQNPSGKVMLARNKFACSFVILCPETIWIKWISESGYVPKATSNVVPQHWQPNSGLLMTNDVSGVNPEEAVPCIALSKNDSYVMSACGGKVSLFNMMTFKVCLNITVLHLHQIWHLKWFSWCCFHL